MSQIYTRIREHRGLRELLKFVCAGVIYTTKQIFISVFGMGLNMLKFEFSLEFAYTPLITIFIIYHLDFMSCKLLRA